MGRTKHHVLVADNFLTPAVPVVRVHRTIDPPRSVQAELLRPGLTLMQRFHRSVLRAVLLLERQPVSVADSNFLVSGQVSRLHDLM